MLKMSEVLKWANLAAGIGLLGGMPVHAAPASESSPPPPPAAGISSKALEQVSTGAWVNEYTGQPSFSIPLAAVSNQGGISFSVGLQYSGAGLEHGSLSKAQYNPVSWVGEGFYLAAPSISVDHKGTVSLADDEYSVSLEGNSSTPLIPENTANSDVFYPSSSPYVKVQRERLSVTMNLSDPNLNMGGGTLPPTSVPSVTADVVVGWTVTMPDGSKYKFGAGAAACDDNNAPVFCTATTGDKLGYEPFYNYGSGVNTSRIPVQWFLREIRSTDNLFSIFLEYEKTVASVSGIIYGSGSPASPTVKADRAIYLKRVYSVNGTLATDPKISMVVLDRVARNPVDYFDNSAVDPLARFETQRLASVSTYIRDNANPEVTLRLFFTPSGTYTRTRLTDVKETRGTRERRLYTFAYDDAGGAPWRIKTVKAPNSAEWTYSYAPAAGTLSLDPQSLNLTTLSFNGTTVNPIADFVKPQVFMHKQMGNKLYLGLEDGSTCTSPSGNRWKRRLVELENFGTHWAVQRVFMSAHANCPDKNPVSIAPDGSYMAWSADGNVRIFALIPRVGNAGAIDLASPPSGMLLLNQNMHHTTGSAVKAVLFTYENWMVAHDEVSKRALTFYYRNASGQWARDNSTGCAEVLPSTLRNSFEEGIFTSPYECIRWEPAYGEIEVRGGNNFIAVKFNETWTSSTADDGSSIRLYSYRNGAVNEFKYGLHKSRRQKLGSSSTRIPFVESSEGMLDRDFLWDPAFDDGPTGEGTTIMDMSVRGNLVGLVLGWRDSPTLGKPRYLYVFGFDGRQLRFLYQRALANTPVSYQGAHIFLGENYFLYRNESSNTFDYHFFNPKTWSVSAPVTLSGTYSTALKVLDGYFHMENLTDRSKSFQAAVVSPTLDIYTGTSTSGKLYAVDPAGAAPAQVNNLNPNAAPQANFLYNVFQQGDRFLGIAKNQSGTNTWTYAYVHTQASGNQTQWLPVPVGVSGMAATLISTGVMTMEQTVTSATDHKFSGVLRFHGDYKGALLGPSSPQPNVVTRVDVLTKSSQSQISDGSLKRLDISYPASPRFNHAGKIPNMNQVVVSDVAGKRKNTSDYIVDYVPRDPTLPPNSIFQGMISSRALSNVPASGTGLRPGDARMQMRYRINNITKGWDGTTDLRESIRVPFLTKTTEDQYYFEASMATETRYALPNAKLGRPQVTISKNGGDFNASVVRFQHEFGTSAANTLPAQTASYMFKSDPCTGGNPDDPCANLVNFNWLIPSSGDPQASANSKRALASQVFTFSSAGHPVAQYSWRSLVAGVTGLTTLNGTTGSGNPTEEGRWIKDSEILQRASNHPSTLSKHGGPTLVDARGAYTTTFYSGREGMVLATVLNSSKSVCTFLDAEEEVYGTGRGAYGDWETQGEVSTDLAHTGTRSLKVTAGFGPTVNLEYRRDANFWPRVKGVLVSGWMFVPSAAADPNPAAMIDLRPYATANPTSTIDLLAEYKAAHGGTYPVDRWFKLERLITWDQLNTVPFTESDPNSKPLIRLWFGKVNPASNAHPVYVDDLRVHPADAAMATRTFDASQRISSQSDSYNRPLFYNYDSWGQSLGAKDDQGRIFSTTAYKRIED